MLKTKSGQIMNETKEKSNVKLNKREGVGGDEGCISWNLFVFDMNFCTAMDIFIFVVINSLFSGHIPISKISKKNFYST